MHSVKVLTAILIGAWAQDATARDITVQFGQSIQAAVDLASPGDRILVQPGTYREHGRYCPTDSSKVCAVVVSGGALVDQPWLRFHIPLHAQVRAHSLSTPAERMRRYRCAAVTPIPQILRA